MYTYAESHHTKLQIKQLSNVYILEVAYGIYYVEKDRVGMHSSDFVNAKSVISALNNVEKVAVEKMDGTIFSNTLI